jgi:fatty-acyl-CoA synthase
LVAVNTRLSSGEAASILELFEAALLVHDPAFDELVDAVADRMLKPPRRIRAGSGDDGRYECLLATAAPRHDTPSDERSLLSIDYTAGTTGQPKGVMYHHRGAFLQALAMVGHTGLAPSTVLLWTLPMFPCDGWCFPWAVTAAGGTHVCSSRVDPAEVWRLIRQEGVTHFNAAPTVLSMIASAEAAGSGVTDGRTVRIATGGAPPSPAVLRRMGALGFEVTHLYGLTEIYGPAMLRDWRPEWDELGIEAKDGLTARQGVGNMVAFKPRVITEDGSDVPADGTTIGHIALRGNNLMLGYLKDPEATAAAVPDGWFRTGDLGVTHQDGYVELRDRSKDEVMSGGENIASVEVKQVIMDHPPVVEAAVVAMSDECGGEVPAAYVILRDGASATEAKIIEHVWGRFARFKAPKTVTFGRRPKTSTGTIQKYVLGERARGKVSAGLGETAPNAG